MNAERRCAMLPVAVSAAAFGTLHAVLRHGPPYKRMQRFFEKNQEEQATEALRNPDVPVPPRPAPPVLAAQAEARVLNDIHNALVVPMATVALFQAALKADKLYGTTALSNLYTVIAAGYFWMDSLIVTRNFKEHGVAPLLHAAICIVFFTFSHVTRKMHYFGARVLMFELSTPLVHLRWLLHALRKTRTKAYKTNGLAMMGVFGAVRVLFGTRVLVDFFKVCSDADRRLPGTKAVSRTTVHLGQILGCGIQTLNFFWMSKMIKGAVKVFRK